MRKKRIVITPILVFFVLFVTVIFSVQAQSLNKKDFSSTVKKRNPAFAISAAAVFHKLKENQSITLIDVRGKDQFEAVHIPGSINIPLYAVKTKTYLKSTPLILINEGYHYEPLERECAYLRKAGFQAWILFGGLYSWRQKGGLLQGDHFKQGELNKVPPPIFFTERAYEDWIIIDMAPTKNAKASSLIPRSTHIPFSNKTAVFTATLQKTIAQRKGNPLRSLIFFNEKGEGYDTVERVLHKADYEVFFLKGGLEAYNRFVTNLALIRQARENAKRTIKRCINCP